MPESEWQQARSAVLEASGKVIRTIAKIDAVGPVARDPATDRTHDYRAYLREELLALRVAVGALLIRLPRADD